MKTIFVNARFLTQPVTGVQRFAIEVCTKLTQLNENIQLICPHDILDKKLANQLNAKVVGKGTGHFWEQFELPLLLKKHKNPFLLNLCNTAPLFYYKNIITLHDLAFIKHPEWFSFAFRSYYNFMMPKIAKNARFIFTVSKSVKQDLQETFNLTITDVDVIYNGLPSTFLKRSLVESDQTANPYFIAFGGKNPRKNITNILKAMELLNRKDFDLHVISRAEKNFKGKSIEDNLFPFNVVVHNDIDDEKLKALYKNSRGLLYPSLYEGFGLPPLEAINSGCPILLSKISVFTELYSDVAIFCDPNSPEDIKKGINKLIDQKHITIDSTKLDAINN